MPRLWSVHEVAVFLNVRPHHVYELVYDRQIPFTKVWHEQLAFDPAAIWAWLEEQTTQLEGGLIP